MARSVMFPVVGILLATMVNPITRVPMLVPVALLMALVQAGLLVAVMSWQFWLEFRKRGCTFGASWRWAAPLALLVVLGPMLMPLWIFAEPLQMGAHVVLVWLLLRQRRDEEGRSLATASRVARFGGVAVVAFYFAKVPGAMVAFSAPLWLR